MAWYDDVQTLEAFIRFCEEEVEINEKAVRSLRARPRLWTAEYEAWRKELPSIEETPE